MNKLSDNIVMQNYKGKLRLEPSPHVRDNTTTRTLMTDVVIALVPAGIGAVYYYGLKALWLIIACVVAAALTELFWQKLSKKPVTISDMSAVVTGVLLAYNLPPDIPLWIAVVGSIFAILVIKQLFGGIGQNFMNPALSARVMMLLSWGLYMTTFRAPATAIDAVSGATPLALISQGTLPHSGAILRDLFLGNIGGCIGETSKLLLLVGGIYLIVRKVIHPRMPVAMLGSMAVMALLFGGGEGTRLYMIAAHLLSGGAMIGAFFMITDYSSSPLTIKGQWIYGIGCGVLTMIIRLWGATPEGASYAILLMNAATPLIERLTHPKTFGEERLKRT